MFLVGLLIKSIDYVNILVGLLNKSIAYHCTTSWNVLRSVQLSTLVHLFWI